MSVLAASRVGIDNAGGGLILGDLQPHVKINGVSWAVFGALIASHGAAPHDAATISTASTFVKLNGVAPAAVGHLASCGHALTGTAHVKIES